MSVCQHVFMSAGISVSCDQFAEIELLWLTFIQFYCLFISLSVCMFVCLSVYLPGYLYACMFVLMLTNFNSVMKNSINISQHLLSQNLDFSCFHIQKICVIIIKNKSYNRAEDSKKSIHLLIFPFTSPTEKVKIHKKISS